MFEREAARPGNVLQSEEKRHIGVSNRDAFKVVVVRCQKVEEILTTVAVKDDLSIACRFDRDWFFGRAALSQIVRTIERRSQRRSIAVETAVDKPAVLIESSMQKNHVAGLDPGRH